MSFIKNRNHVRDLILIHEGRTFEELYEALVSGGMMTKEELKECLESLIREGRIKEVRGTYLAFGR